MNDQEKAIHDIFTAAFSELTVEELVTLTMEPFEELRRSN